MVARLLSFYRAFFSTWSLVQGEVARGSWLRSCSQRCNSKTWVEVHWGSNGLGKWNGVGKNGHVFVQHSWHKTFLDRRREIYQSIQTWLDFIVCSIQQISLLLKGHIFLRTRRLPREWVFRSSQGNRRRFDRPGCQNRSI